MARRLFSHDPYTGITKYWHYDASNDRAHIETTQDVSDILDMNKREKNSGINEKDHGLGRKVGSIPLSIYYEWKKEASARGLDPDETSAFILAKLKSRDFCHFMTVDKV